MYQLRRKIESGHLLLLNDEEIEICKNIAKLLRSGELTYLQINKVLHAVDEELYKKSIEEPLKPL